MHEFPVILSSGRKRELGIFNNPQFPFPVANFNEHLHKILSQNLCLKFLIG